MIQSLGFRLFLFFFLADIALLGMLLWEDDRYDMPPLAVIASELPPRTAASTEIISAVASPTARSAAADTAYQNRGVVVTPINGVEHTALPRLGTDIRTSKGSVVDSTNRFLLKSTGTVGDDSRTTHTPTK
ncbi:hypothetical protein [Rhodoflexus sp.]